MAQAKLFVILAGEYWAFFVDNIGKVEEVNKYFFIYSSIYLFLYIYILAMSPLTYNL